MIDWFVLLTPLVLLPTFLLLSFIGCQEILGIEEGVPSPPDPPPEPDPDEEITFTYEPNLQVPDGVPPITRVAWIFSEDLEYEPGEDFPLGYDLGLHNRYSDTPNPSERIQLAGETVQHGPIGNPVGQKVYCDCRIFVEGMVMAYLIQVAEREVGDIDFAHFTLQQDLTFV